MNKKYELTNMTMKHKGKTLYRIRALKDFSNVKAGDLGGWIESEDNLSHYDNSWVYDEGKVYDNGKVHDNGTIHQHGRVFGHGIVFKNGKIFGDGKVFDNGLVFGNGQVYGDGMVYGNGRVFDNGKVHGDGEIFGAGAVYGNGDVSDGTITTKVSIPYKAIIQIQCKKRNINALLTKDDKIVFNVGCQTNITKEEFFNRIYREDGGLERNPHRQEYLDHIEYMESYLLSKKRRK